MSPAPQALQGGPAMDVHVHGSGIVGCACALALAATGLRVGLSTDATDATSAARGPDVRTYAINAASQALLERLGAWGSLKEGVCTPVYDMRVAGDDPGAGLSFSAWQQRVRELAWIVDAAALEAALKQRVQAAGIERIDRIERIGVDAAPHAALDVIAEGKASAARARLGVRFDRHDYGQHAVAARLVSTQPHQNTARQWFLSPEVLALLPFDPPQAMHGFGLVWSVPSERARALMAMPVQAFEAALNDATQGAAGVLSLASERATWPLSIGRADRVAGAGWVLVGDAAHQVHPLAGQGLNLGLGDVSALVDVLAHREPWRSLGDERLLARYQRQRVWPVAAMSGMTDALQLLFAHPSPLVRELRNRGLGLVQGLTPLKRWLAGEALGR